MTTMAALDAIKTLSGENAALKATVRNLSDKLREAEAERDFQANEAQIFIGFADRWEEAAHRSQVRRKDAERELRVAEQRIAALEAALNGGSEPGDPGPIALAEV